MAALKAAPLSAHHINETVDSCYERFVYLSFHEDERCSTADQSALRSPMNLASDRRAVDSLYERSQRSGFLASELDAMRTLMDQIQRDEQGG